MRWDRFVVVVLALLLVWVNLVCFTVRTSEPSGGGVRVVRAEAAWNAPSASSLPEELAVRAILGESGRSYAEMRAVAWALANRGTFQGVYGLRRVSGDYRDERGYAYDEERIQRAMRAWGEEGGDNHGADHWLSESDIRTCKPHLTAFRFRMREVGTWGTTRFYKAWR